MGHGPPASIGDRGLVSAVGPTSIGVVGDLRRTNRSLSAASKPRLLSQRTARSLHPSREKERDIFSGGENFNSCWGKYVERIRESTLPLCVYVALCRKMFGFRPQARGGIVNIGDVLRTCSPGGMCASPLRPSRGWCSLSGVCGFVFPLPPFPVVWWACEWSDADRG